MTRTNLQGMPPLLTRFLETKTHDRGDAYASASELLLPPRIFHLRRRHEEAIVRDLSEEVYSLWGSMAHAAIEVSHQQRVLDAAKRVESMLREGEGVVGDDNIERAFEEVAEAIEEVARGTAILEERWFAELEIEDGIVRISGQTDHLDFDSETHLFDLKTTAVYWFQRQEKLVARLREWNQAGNVYHWLLVENGYPPETRVTYVAMLRDWHRRAAHGDGYPRRMYEPVEVEVWPRKKQEDFIVGRLRGLLAAEGLPDAELPPCTEEERWADPCFRVEDRKTGRAIPGGASLATKKEAYALIAERGASGVRIVAGGTPTRCLDYCPVRSVCSQWAADSRNPRNVPRSERGQPLIG
jgi:hypothetical protein